MRLPIVKMPDRVGMLSRLTKVNPEPHLVQKFYPSIMKNAGKELNHMGVVLMLLLAAEDYLVGLPSFIRVVLYEQFPDFIDAIVDDKELAKEAKKFWATTSSQ